MPCVAYLGLSLVVQNNENYPQRVGVLSSLGEQNQPTNPIQRCGASYLPLSSNGLSANNSPETLSSKRIHTRVLSSTTRQRPVNTCSPITFFFGNKKQL